MKVRVLSFFFLPTASSDHLLSPNVCLCILAGVHLLFPHARLAFHMAAPAHLAVAGQAGEPHGRVVAASTAQTLTACVFGARPAPRARRVAGGPAEAGGVLQVDQVSVPGALAMAFGPRKLSLSCGRIGDAQHSHGVVVSILQQPPSVMERGQLLPASPYGTGAGDSMTFAGCFQPTLHCLR